MRFIKLTLEFGDREIHVPSCLALYASRPTGDPR